MVTKIGMACGICPSCGRKFCRPSPADYAVCDCWEHCPRDHGKGPYATKMEFYTPDLTPSTYSPIDSPQAYGDLQHPMKILMWCPICRYYSAQKPVEVKLT